MQPDTGWSTGQRALLRFLEQQGILTTEPTAPAAGRPTNADLFAAFAEAIDQQGLVDLVSKALRIAAVDLQDFAPMADLVALIPADVARRGEVVPLAQYDGTLEVAASNPLDLEAVKSVEFTTGLRVRTKIARRGDVCRAVSAAYGVVPAPEQPQSSGADLAAATAEPAVAEPPVDDAPAETPVSAPAPPPSVGAWSFETETGETPGAEAARATTLADATDDADETDLGVVRAWAEAETDTEPDAGTEGETDTDPLAVVGDVSEALAEAEQWATAAASRAEESLGPVDGDAIEPAPANDLGDVQALAGFDDVQLDEDPATHDEAGVASDAAAPVTMLPIDVLTDMAAEPGRVADAGVDAAVTLARPAVLVVSRDLSRRVALREALEAAAAAPCVLTMRDELEARSVLGLGRIAVVVVEGGALASDGRPLWEVLRGRATGIVVWGGRPLASGVVGLDRDTTAFDVAAQVCALLGEASDD